MLTVEDALARMLSRADPLGVESVETLHANGRVLAADVISPMPVPPLDNSQMDGYAVRTLDVPAAGVTLPVSQRIAAGHVGTPLAPGTAARIFTGAPVPAGADAVVMQESALAQGDRVTLQEIPQRGAWIRRAGLDVAAGATVAGAGMRLGPQHVGLIASVGAARVTVHRRLRVAVFFTGDELAMPGERLAPGRIYNSNRFVLRALLERLGCEVTDLGIVPDERARTRAAFVTAASGSDLIVTSGGVSVGEEDHVRPAVEAEGALQLWQIAMKPGKPVAFGHVRNVPFIGLPGNPVSSFVTFLLFARPFILRRQGVNDVKVPALPLRADFEWPKPDRRREFLRVCRNAEYGLDLFPMQNSAVLTSTAWADGLVDLPADTVVARGNVVRYLSFADLLN
ncbi:MAG TPA: gephyrin-like molybdotransferase Glp [Burkholderiaceae bacterium]|nr:gephyrin-like molybdotransferase Glp [Burkholderiaceae bacterium]